MKKGVMQSMVKGMMWYDPFRQRSSGAPPVQGKDPGFTRDGRNPQQDRIPEQEIQPPNTPPELFLSQGMVSNPIQPAVKGTRHRTLCMRRQGVPLGLGNGGAEGGMKGLKHVEDRDHAARSLSLYGSRPREQVREEDDKIHEGVCNRLVQERELKTDWKGRASCQRRLLC